jgi:hypothetical protein
MTIIALVITVVLIILTLVAVVGRRSRGAVFIDCRVAVCRGLSGAVLPTAKSDQGKDEGQGDSSKQS